MMTHLKHTLLAAMTLLMATHISAEERWFQIELLIFENPQLETDNPESFINFNENEVETKRTISLLERIESSSDLALDFELAVDPKTLTALMPLDSNVQQLSVQKNAIERARRRILFHEAWNQPIPNKSNVIPMTISGGNEYAEQTELSGSIAIYVERYLHVNSRLRLTRFEETNNPFDIITFDSPISSNSFEMRLDDTTDLNNTNLFDAQESFSQAVFYIPTEQANLIENRRLRSRQLHYFDHPRFGMLVYITPINTEFQPNEQPINIQ